MDALGDAGDAETSIMMLYNRQFHTFSVENSAYFVPTDIVC